MEETNLPVLYIGTDCPRSREVRDVLVGHGISHREVNISSNVAAFSEMERVSGQTNTPTLDWHGDVLADFDAEELVEFLHAHDVVLEDS